MTNVTREVVNEIYKAFQTLGAESDLLGIVGSWGDSIPEADVLTMLKGWNEATGHTERREKISRHPGYNHTLAH